MLNKSEIRVTAIDEGTGWVTEEIHAIEGVIFGKGYECSTEGKEETITYKALEGCPAWVEALRSAVSSGEFVSMTYYTLVRHGEPWKGGGYYPLPLLFSTEGVRSASAEEVGKNPPPARWVRRKRNEVLRVLGLTDFKEIGQSE